MCFCDTANSVLKWRRVFEIATHCQRICANFADEEKGRGGGFTFEVAHIVSAMSDEERESALTRFASASSGVCVLVCTDAMSRGIDVAKIEHIVNVDVPSEIEQYVHRVGRTARGTGKGVAWSIGAKAEHSRLKTLLRRAHNGTKLRRWKQEIEGMQTHRQLFKTYMEMMDSKYMFRQKKLHGKCHALLKRRIAKVMNIIVKKQENRSAQAMEKVKHFKNMQHNSNIDTFGPPPDDTAKTAVVETKTAEKKTVQKKNEKENTAEDVDDWWME